MSKLAKKLIQERETRRSAVRESVEESGAKILVLDIERMKGSASIEFWDLGDYKNRRIPADTVTEWPRSICAAWGWVGKDEIHFASEWDNGRRGMLIKTWEAFDKAEYVVGHNLQNFDAKKLNSEWRDIGLTPPSPYRVIDTLRVARSAFGDESKTLDALTKRCGLASKTDRYDVEVARAALAGDVEAQKKIESYNIGDIHASTALYFEMLPWIRGVGHIAPDSSPEGNTCPRCNSSEVRRATVSTWSAGVYRYKAYTCNNCGGHYRGVYQSKGQSVRSL